MIRRLEIACAMLIKPKIMFLDEPTIGLDPAARRVVWERLNVFKKEYGVTIFFNTHYMDEAESYADEIAIINKGKIVALGKSEELRRYLGGEIITFTIDKTTLKPNMIQSMQRLSFVKNVFENGNLSVLVSDVEFALPRLMSFLKDEGYMWRKSS
jgi:ABC-2 type transport system ATP-binding protein